MKKFFIAFCVVLIIAGAFGFYGALKYRAQLRAQRQTAKLPERTITLIEGWDSLDIASYLDKQGIVKSGDFLKALKTFDVSTFSDVLPAQTQGSLEGFVFPDTYFIPQTAPSGTSISDIIIKKALSNFSLKISPQMLAQAQADNMSLYQIITLASIVEKEGKNDSDRKIIAGVFYNRLKAGMALQSDATVSYALGRPNLTADDLRINSPYNTYKNTGLPVGPICNPSLNSIMAALYPSPSNYLYFLTDPKTRLAVFAKTNDEQNANKQKYLR